MILSLKRLHIYEGLPEMHKETRGGDSLDSLEALTPTRGAASIHIYNK